MKRSKNYSCSDRHLRRKVKIENDKSLERIYSRFLSIQQSTNSSNIEDIPSYSFDKQLNICLENKDTSQTCTHSVLDVNSISTFQKNTNDINTQEKSTDNLDIAVHTSEEGINNSWNNVLYEDWFPSTTVPVPSAELIVKESDIFENDDNRYSDDEDEFFEQKFNELFGDFQDDQTNNANSNVIENVEYDKSREDSNNITQTISESLKNILGPWAVDCNIRHGAISKLLHRIRIEIPILSLPLHPRTLLKTPRNTNIDKIAGGLYCHFGLRKCIDKIIEKRLISNIANKEIDLLINIDGAPLGSSSEKSLWPILCSDKYSKDVYIIGVYCGQGKPTDVNEFLDPFVKETIKLMQSGIPSNENHYTLNIYALILDAPAKAFVLAVKYHSGYDCCTKCTIEGTMYNCVCFPGKIGLLRTDAEFRSYAYQDDYQRSKSILNTIPNLGLVTNVPLDAMHLIYLGCTKKLLLMWLCSTTHYKLPQLKQDIISNNLLSLTDHIPSDFARKPRHLRYIKFFKATEFRQLLEYTGPIALKNIIDEDVYINFLTLHVAVRILNTPKLCADQMYIDYAEKLLVKFVEHFELLYGPGYVTYNFHNLQHLANDVRRYGQLEEFSAFRFENFICRIKQLIRTGNAPLQQLMRRCAEIEVMQNIQDTNTSKNAFLKMQHSHGPLTVDCNITDVLQYKMVIFKETKFNCYDGKNMYALIDEKVVKALNFIKYKNSNEIYVVGQHMQILGNFYDNPLPSSTLGIYTVRNIQSNIETWNLQTISTKLCILPYKNDYVVFPILHTSF